MRCQNCAPAAGHLRIRTSFSTRRLSTSRTSERRSSNYTWRKRGKCRPPGLSTAPHCCLLQQRLVLAASSPTPPRSRLHAHASTLTPPRPRLGLTGRFSKRSWTPCAPSTSSCFGSATRTTAAPRRSVLPVSRRWWRPRCSWRLASSRVRGQAVLPTFLRDNQIACPPALQRPGIHPRFCRVLRLISSRPLCAFSFARSFEARRRRPRRPVRSLRLQRVRQPGRRPAVAQGERPGDGTQRPVGCVV